MQFEYRYLSKEKIEEIDAKRYANMYGALISIGSGECITSEDETIVFRYIGGHPGDEYPEESFLYYYKGWYYYVYIFNESVKAEKQKTEKIGTRGVELKELVMLLYTKTKMRHLKNKNS